MVSQNPNITLEFLAEFPEIKVSWDNITRNPAMTWK